MREGKRRQRGIERDRHRDREFAIMELWSPFFFLPWDNLTQIILSNYQIYTTFYLK